MKVWVSKDEKVRVRMSDDEHVVEVSLRMRPDEIWRRPVLMEREK